MKRVLRFRAVNRDIFNAIRNGKKKVETRAASIRYLNIKAGDKVTLVCGKTHFEKEVRRVRKFPSVRALTRVYRPASINLKCRTTKELETMYFTFPGYREKLKRHGIVALELR